MTAFQGAMGSMATGTFVDSEGEEIRLFLPCFKKDAARSLSGTHWELAGHIADALENSEICEDADAFCFDRKDWEVMRGHIRRSRFIMQQTRLGKRIKAAVKDHAGACIMTGDFRILGPA